MYSHCGVDHIKSSKGYLSHGRDGGEWIHAKTQFLYRVSPDVYQFEKALGGNSRTAIGWKWRGLLYQYRLVLKVSAVRYSPFFQLKLGAYSFFSLHPMRPLLCSKLIFPLQGWLGT